MDLYMDPIWIPYINPRWLEKGYDHSKKPVGRMGNIDNLIDHHGVVRCGLDGQVLLREGDDTDLLQDRRVDEPAKDVGGRIQELAARLGSPKLCTSFGRSHFLVLLAVPQSDLETQPSCKATT